jgi:hypothetical protein
MGLTNVSWDDVDRNKVRVTEWSAGVLTYNLPKLDLIRKLS